MIYYDPQASELLKQKWMPQAYVVLNLTNGKVYNGIVINVGCTWEKRTDKELNQTGTPNKHFLRAIQKVGRRKFHRYLFAVADTVEEIREVEKQQILDTWSHLPEFGYNKTMGGEGCVSTDEINKKRSDTAKRKMNDPSDPWLANLKKAFAAFQKHRRETIGYIIVDWMRQRSESFASRSRAARVGERMSRVPLWVFNKVEVDRICDRSRDPEFCQKVVELYWRQGLSNGQIMKETGQSRNRVNGQISSICLMSKGLRADHSGPLKRAVTPSVCGEQK
jgi:hypothetical protein